MDLKPNIDEQQPKMVRNILQSSLLNAGFSIVFQILCRFLTFGINAYIVRSVGREVLGIMNVRLLLLESTLLFLSQEAIIRAALSSTSQHCNKSSWAQLINQMWLTVPICCVICIPCIYIWLEVLSPVDPKLYEQYRYACYAIALSCIVELCAQAPVFIIQVFCFVKLKVILNTLHIFVRSIIFLWIVGIDKDIAINAFGTAQFASAITILVGHYGFFYFYLKKFVEYRRKRFPTGDYLRLKAKKVQTKNILYENMDGFPFRKVSELLPFVLENDQKKLNANLQILTLSFIKQGVLKQILTEGEKYVMSISPVLNFSEQATYDVVNNLGSMAARFVFRPIEDNAYFFFTQTISRDSTLELQDRSLVLHVSKVLYNIIKVVTSIGLMALVFGQSYADTLLLLYGGADFVEGGLPGYLLRWHCLAILFLAINGITEGYMFATNTSKDIDKYNYIMAIFSISFLILSYVLTSFFGPVGFIFANCINMICRILYSTRFICRQYQPIGLNPLTGLFPGIVFGSMLFIACCICTYSMYYSTSMIHHLFAGVICVGFCVLAWAAENYDLVKLSLHRKID